MAESLRASVVGDRIVFRGPPLAAIRGKAEVSALVGSRNLRVLSATAFDVGIAFADRLSDYLPATDRAATHATTSAEAHRTARLRALSIVAERDAGDVESSWEAVLDAHQKVAVHAMTVPGLRGLCLFDEQGSGKTVMALAAFDLLREAGEVEWLAVVCPKSMLSEWRKDADRLMPGKYRTAVVEGDPVERRRVVMERTDVLILGYESVAGLLVPLGAACGARRTLLVADESFYVKSPDAVRSRAIRDLRRRCLRCFVLCGTPAPNGAEDLVHQFDLADDGYTFADTAVEDPGSVRAAIEVRGTYVRRLKQETLPGLPPKEFHLVRVPLAGRQARLYGDVRDELTVWLKGMDNRSFQRQYTDYLAQRSALLQICACPHEIDPLFSEVHAKLRAVDTLLATIMALPDRKVIIWSFYRASLTELSVRYSHFGAVLVDGSVSGTVRRAAVERFQTDPAVRLFVGNPAACGAGITLTAAAAAIYVSFSNQAAHFLQSLDRIHRRGQTAEVVEYHLVICEGTLEEAELTRLRGKEITQGRLLGDPDRRIISLDEALDELSGHGPTALGDE